jgi:hypothetical protein
MKPCANKKFFSCTDSPDDQENPPHGHIATNAIKHGLMLLQTQKASGKYGACAVHQLKGDGHLK